MDAKEAFEKFLDECIIGEGSLLTDDPKLFTREDLNNCLNRVQGIKDTTELKAPNDATTIKIVAHALWFKVFADEHFPNKYQSLIDNIGTLEEGQKKRKQPEWLKKEDYKKVKGIGSGGTTWSGYKVVSEVVQPILAMWLTWKDKKGNLEDIITQCLRGRVEYERISFKIPAPLCNILLHLCKPDKYEPIITDADKNKIVKVLYPVFMESKEPEEDEDREKSIESIKKKMQEQYFSTRNNGTAFFYEPTIRALWKDNSILKDGLTVAQQLEYKKAMILYGPPGTGKTHDVGVLIDQIVERFYLKYKEKYDGKLKEYLKGSESFKKEFKKEYVLNLQMHVNYSYDDFVIGQIFKDGKTVVKPGALLQFIEGMKQEHPYFVVLDEINRVDISRVFGEVFSAMEYRNEEIDLSIKGKDENGEDCGTICIPDNLYFIGTMNEIDFSLEHIDFALRRRFVWVRKGFNNDVLSEIIEYKISESKQEEEKKTKMSDWDVDAYLNACKALNDKITGETSLGENYEIGHTFFAEIVPIYEKLLENNNKATIEQAKQILWQISIKPTLEAYCGSMSETTRQNFIGEDAKGNDKGVAKSCRAIFLGKDSSNESSNE